MKKINVELTVGKAYHLFTENMNGKGKPAGEVIFDLLADSEYAHLIGKLIATQDEAYLKEKNILVGKKGKFLEYVDDKYTCTAEVISYSEINNCSYIVEITATGRTPRHTTLSEEKVIRGFRLGEEFKEASTNSQKKPFTVNINH